MSGNILELRNVSFSYPGYGNSPKVEALKNVSLSVREGSFTVILGHNGSGKSTLANIMCALLDADSGDVIIDGKNLTDPKITDEEILEARKKVGMVFQNPDNQIVATVVEDDVAFGCENLGIPSEEIRKRVDEALETVGMSKYARHAPHKLSGGQKQRVAIAGIIAMKRKVIVFDESTAMLDPEGRKDVLETIEKLRREDNVTVILITHYMNEAALADYLVVLNEGEVLTEGTPGEVFSNPSVLWNVSLDVPQSTEILFKLRKKGLDVRLDIFDEKECAAEILRAVGKMESSAASGSGGSDADS